jgi:hypothetical protein
MNLARDRAAAPAARAAAAAAIDADDPRPAPAGPARRARRCCWPRDGADVLPDDRADLFYSKYSGGGMDITGESVLGAQEIHGEFRARGSYFVDKVSGASVDVLSQASVIKDERKQKSVTVDVRARQDHLHALVHQQHRARLHLEHAARLAESGHVRRPDDDDARLRSHARQGRREQRHGVRTECCWLGHAESRSYELGLSQILTRNWITSLNSTSSPTTAIRESLSVDSLSRSHGRQGLLARQPGLSGHAHEHRGRRRTKYYLPYRAAASLSYRYFRDTWAHRRQHLRIRLHPADLEHLDPRGPPFRYYQQTHASFYSDLFPYANAEFDGARQGLGRLEEHTIGAKATYAFLPEGWKMFKRGTATLDISEIRFKYLDFRDIKDYGDTPAGGSYAPGDEPLYHFNAIIYQVYLSMFF